MRVRVGDDAADRRGVALVDRRGHRAVLERRWRVVVDVPAGPAVAQRAAGALEKPTQRLSGGGRGPRVGGAVVLDRRAEIELEIAVEAPAGAGVDVVEPR